MSLCCCNTINCLYVVATAGFLLYNILSHHTDIGYIGQFLIIFSITLMKCITSGFDIQMRLLQKRTLKRKRRNTQHQWFHHLKPAQSPERRGTKTMLMLIQLYNHIVLDLRPSIRLYRAFSPSVPFSSHLVFSSLSARTVILAVRVSLSMLHPTH